MSSIAPPTQTQTHTQSLVASYLIDQVNNQPINLITTLQKQLENIPSEQIQLFCRKLYPVEMNVGNVYNGLYRTLINYYCIQFNKSILYDIILQDITRIAASISQQFSTKLNKILSQQQTRKKIQQNTSKKNPNPTPTAKLTKAPTTTLLQSLGAKYNMKETANTKYTQSILNKQLNDTYKKQPHVVTVDPALIAEKYVKEKMLVENLSARAIMERQLRQFGEFSKKKCLVCDNTLNMSNVELKKLHFKCQDCGQLFHRKCMPRDNNCAICQLTNIHPLQKPKLLYFLGILRKSTKKHQLEFQLKKQHIQQSPSSSTNKKSLTIMPNLQLRCIRLKQTNDSVSNFINLFPDACTIMINSRLVKEFQPLHKQSSLKYRRDQCVRLPANLLNFGMNKITITERILKKEVKSDQRIEPENHLVGIFAVDNLQVPKQANKLQQFLTKSGFLNGNTPTSVQKFLAQMDSKLSTFDSSQNLLKKSMFMSSKTQNQAQMQQQQIACDTIKVPLVCSLTLQKMKYPGRSIFCKHFACFDVYNFILLNAQAKIPKWQCPICKGSAYKFQIDCIMSSIVQQLQKQYQSKKPTKQPQQPSQVQFNRNFNIKFLDNKGKYMTDKKNKLLQKNIQDDLIVESQLIPAWINNVYDLPIEGKSKRQSNCQRQERGQSGRKGLKISDNTPKQQKQKDSHQLLQPQKTLSIQSLIQTPQPVKTIKISSPSSYQQIKIVQKQKGQKLQKLPQLIDFSIRVDAIGQKEKEVDGKDEGKSVEKDKQKENNKSFNIGEEQHRNGEDNGYQIYNAYEMRSQNEQQLWLEKALLQYQQQRKSKITNKYPDSELPPSPSPQPQLHPSSKPAFPQKQSPHYHYTILPDNKIPQNIPYQSPQKQQLSYRKPQQQCQSIMNQLNTPNDVESLFLNSDEFQKQKQKQDKEYFGQDTIYNKNGGGIDGSKDNKDDGKVVNVSKTKANFIDHDYLYQGYTSRTNPQAQKNTQRQQGKKKVTKVVGLYKASNNNGQGNETQKKSVTPIVRQKLNRAAKQKYVLKKFQIPQDADVIELSD